MAEEWYLLSGKHDIVSGFEAEALFDYGPESFLELLDSDIADDVVICNYDLSICVKRKAIIQNNLQDTKLKTLSRAMLVPIGSCKAGMYVKYKEKYWLIVGLVDDNKVYEKAIMHICNYRLDWIGRDGNPVSRWAHVESASQYNNGETNVKNYFIRTDQLMIHIPDDDESLMINSGTRFIIDRRCQIYERKFAKNIIFDTSNPVVCYDVTRTDSVLYNYQGSGYFQLLATQDEQREDDGYYMIDGVGYWLCQKPVPQTEVILPSAKIEYESNVIYVGMDASVFVGKFYNEAGEEISAAPIWTIAPDMGDKLEVQYVDDSILLYTNDESLASKSFTLTLSSDGVNPVSVEVSIRLFI